MSYLKEHVKDRAKGTMKETKGKVKEAIGRATNNPEMENEGTAEKVAGKVRRKIGEVEKVFDK